MRLTILGGCGAWPTATQGCSGYLVECDGFQILLDPGYATFPLLLAHTAPEAVDAVLVTHGHPDHCADLNPLLRARALSDHPPPPLPVFAPSGAVTAVLGLDEPGMLDHAYQLSEIRPGQEFTLGPFAVRALHLPHFVANTGLRLQARQQTLAYTGDCGPDPAVVALAAGADVLLAEATYPMRVPERHRGHLSSAVDAAREAAAAGVGRLILTHLWPGTDPQLPLAAARPHFPGPIHVASPGLAVELP